MGDPHSNFWQEIEIAFTKMLGWAMWVLMGIAAKLAFDSRTKKLTRKEIIVKVVLSIFGGVMCGTLCNQLGYRDWSLIVTSTGTYLGESLLVFLMSNWRKWVEKLLPPIFKNGKDEKK